MRWSRISSFAGVFLAAVASVATSQPAPDWTRDDSVSGEATLSPEAEYTVVRVQASARAVEATVFLDVALDGDVAFGSGPETTPIVMNASLNDPGVSPTGGTAIPYGFREMVIDGYESHVSSKYVPRGTEGRVIEIRLAWPATDPASRMTTVYDERTRRNVDVVRPLAPRRPLKIKWRATIHADGYDNAPSGAAVDIQEAP